MTVEQTTLDGLPVTLVNGKPLTERQERAWHVVRHAPYGAAADDVGAFLHSLRGRHHQDAHCDYCQQEGSRLLRSKALKPLVTRKRATGLWVCRDPKDALVEQTAIQTVDDGYDPATSEWTF